jgi:hypothetical protein
MRVLLASTCAASQYYVPAPAFRGADVSRDAIAYAPEVYAPEYVPASASLEDLPYFQQTNAYSYSDMYIEPQVESTSNPGGVFGGVLVLAAAVGALAAALLPVRRRAQDLSPVRDVFNLAGPEPVAALAVAANEMPAAPEGWEKVEEFDLWGPEKKADTRIEGGDTLKTYKMPPHAERVQYILTSNGRPVKAKVELWIGPIRSTHELVLDSMNGKAYPIRGTLKFKKVSPVLKVSSNASYEFPLVCGVFVPTEEESKKIEQACEEDMFYSAPLKQTVQGGSTIDGKGGSIRTFHIDPTWEKTQIMVWSKDVGKKSFKTDIEVLQGPNNQKQRFYLRCGGSTQPYHAVIDTPGAGWEIRCNSKKFVEDGKFEIAVAPYGEPVEYHEDPVILQGF